MQYQSGTCTSKHIKQTRRSHACSEMAEGRAHSSTAVPCRVAVASNGGQLKIIINTALFGVWSVCDNQRFGYLMF